MGPTAATTSPVRIVVISSAAGTTRVYEDGRLIQIDSGITGGTTISFR